jgi:hypothetical protein
VDAAQANEASTPLETALAVLLAARRGVAVVIVGSAPSKTPGFYYATEQDALVVQTMRALLELKNVAQVASVDTVADALLHLGVSPAASFGNSSLVLSVRRNTDQGEELYWLFNPTNSDLAVTGSFAAAGVPHQLDFWNATDTKVAQWRRSKDRTLVPVTLPAHATTALLFRNEAAPLHVTATNAASALYDGKNLLVRDQGGVKSVTLSSGKTLTVNLGSAPSPIEIGPWHLVVDEISPAGHTDHSIDLSALADWRNIPELKDAVGSALYSATVTVPASLLSSDRDVLLDLGSVSGAMQVSLNGTLVTNQTTPGGKWSVRRLLVSGNNVITIRLDTTLLNRMAELRNHSVPGYFTITPMNSAPSGLLGPVRLIPASVVKVGQTP